MNLEEKDIECMHDLSCGCQVVITPDTEDDISEEVKRDIINNQKKAILFDTGYLFEVDERNFYIIPVSADQAEELIEQERREMRNENSS